MWLRKKAPPNRRWPSQQCINVWPRDMTRWVPITTAANSGTSISIQMIHPGIIVEGLNHETTVSPEGPAGAEGRYDGERYRSYGRGSQPHARPIPQNPRRNNPLSRPRVKSTGSGTLVRRVLTIIAWRPNILP